MVVIYDSDLIHRPPRRRAITSAKIATNGTKIQSQTIPSPVSVADGAGVGASVLFTGVGVKLGAWVG